MLTAAKTFCFRFGHFELYPHQRLLLDQGRQVDLGSRAFDLLLALVDRPGELLRKSELIERVWPRQVVEENNLHVQVSALRRVLGTRAIVTIPGHGYRFALPMNNEESTEVELPVPADLPPDIEVVTGFGRRTVVMLKLAFVGPMVPGSRQAAEDWHDIFLAFEQHIGEVLARYGGSLHECNAMGVTALFGLPVAREYDVIAAVKAAMEMISAVRSQRWSCLHSYTTAALRGGVAHASVIATPSAKAGSWRLSGSLSLIATALCDAAGAHELWVSEETRFQMIPYFNTQPCGSVSHVGLPQTIPAHLVRGASGISSPIEAAQWRGFTPLVGRANELRILSEALNEAMIGMGRAICMVAEPGLGKSRLISEFSRMLPIGKTRVLHARCQPQLRMSAYAPFAQLLRALLLTLDETLSNSFESDLAEALNKVDENLGNWILTVRRLFALTPDHGVVMVDDLAPSRRMMNEAIVAILSAAARRETLVLLMDDWHWADDASDQVLKELLLACGKQRMMLVVTARPTTALLWPTQVHCANMLLQPLEKTDCIVMIRALCSTPRVSDVVASTIYARTEGNPYFLEELCRALLDRGVLCVEQGVLNARQALHDTDLPLSIEAVIQARLDLLPRHAQEIARLASVLGREFTRMDLELLDRDRGQVAPALAELVDAGLIEATQWVPQMRYRFRHALVQWVAHESLMLRQRRELHQRVADMLMDQCDEPPDEMLDLIAYHCWHGTDVGHAVDFAMRAARQAAQRAAHVVAVQHLQHAITLLEGHSECTDHRYKLLNAYALLGHYLILLQGYASADVIRVCEKARVLNEDGTCGDDRFALTWLLWRYTYVQARLTEGAALAEQLLVMARRGQDGGRLLAAQTAVGVVAFLRGNYQCAEASFEMALQHFNAETERALSHSYGDSPAVFALSFRGMALNMLGRFSAAKASLISAVQLAESIQHPGSLALALYYLGSLWVMHGMLAELTQSSEKLIAVASQHDFVGIHALGQVQRGLIMLAKGGLTAEQGLDWISKHANAVIATGSELFRPLYHLIMAEALASVRHMPQAREQLQRAREVLQQIGPHLSDPELERVHGVLLLVEGDSPGALLHLERATAIALSRQSKLQVLQCAVLMAPLLKVIRGVDAAYACLSQALQSLAEDAHWPLVARARLDLEQFSGKGSALNC